MLFLARNVALYLCVFAAVFSLGSVLPVESFAANQTTRALYGTAADINGNPISDATVTVTKDYSNAPQEILTTLTDASGYYSFDAPLGGSRVRVQASKTGYTFYGEVTFVSSRGVSLENQVVNFTGAQETHRLSGRVIGGNGNGIGYVQIDVTGSLYIRGATNANGDFVFDLPAGGTYTLTPQRFDIYFFPSATTFTNLDHDFSNIVFDQEVRVGGSVTHNGARLTGVTMTLTGTREPTVRDTTTGAYGYDFFIRAADTYTLTPSKQGYSFTPVHRTFGNLTASQTFDFVATPTITLAPLADAYVKGATPTINYGETPDLQTKRAYNAGSGKGRQAYLRFDTSSVTNNTLTRATLRVYGRLNAITEANQNIPVAVFPVSDSAWSETGLLWATKPAPNVPHELARVIVADATARWYEFDITEFINSERAAGRFTTGVLLRNMERGGGGDYYTVFNSREATENQPQLVITP